MTLFLAIVLLVVVLGMTNVKVTGAGPRGPAIAVAIYFALALTAIALVFGILVSAKGWP